jgi:hypothetical protein
MNFSSWAENGAQLHYTLQLQHITILQFGFSSPVPKIREICHPDSDADTFSRSRAVSELRLL